MVVVLPGNNQVANERLRAFAERRCRAGLDFAPVQQLALDAA